MINCGMLGKISELIDLVAIDQFTRFQLYSTFFWEKASSKCLLVYLGLIV